MNKLLITMALALALSGPVFADPGHSSGGGSEGGGGSQTQTYTGTSSYSSANTSVGGYVTGGANCTGDCATGGIILQSTHAEANAYSGAVTGTHSGVDYTGAGAFGTASSTSSGDLTGTGVTGETSGLAEFAAGANATGGSEGNRTEYGLESDASVDGVANSYVDGDGSSSQSTAAIAANVSAASATSTRKGAKVKGGTVGLSGSISHGEVEGGGEGYAGSNASEYGISTAEAEARREDADAKGSANTNSWAFSEAVNGNGIAAAGTIAGAAYRANARVKEYGVETSADYVAGLATGSYTTREGNAGTGGFAEGDAEANAETETTGGEGGEGGGSGGEHGCNGSGCAPNSGGGQSEEHEESENDDD